MKHGFRYGNLLATAGTVLFAAVAQPLPLAAAQVDDLLACRSVENDIARLECFDAAAVVEGAARLPAPAPAKEACPRLSFEDFRLDYKQLVGNCVELSGSLMIFGEMAMLQDGALDTQPVLVEYEHLPREQRQIVVRCGINCRVTVIGSVKDVMFSSGIHATEIRSEWK